MTRETIANLRLSAQHIAQADFTTAQDAVAWMGAMQAQDYQGALWAIALRTSNLTRNDVEQAITDRKIVRTWPMRGTLHFLAAQDVRWMVDLLAPRVIAAAAGRRKQLEITDEVLIKSREIIIGALEGGNCLTRAGLCAILDRHGIATAGQRGIHILHHLAEMGLLCFGPHEGKQPTFVLIDEWLPPTKPKQREEALSELARRYFISHGPASLKDFAGWANLTMTDAKFGLEQAKSSLLSETVQTIEYWFSPTIAPAGNSTFLLPGFDEYMLGYKDRTAALLAEHSNQIVPGGNGMFISTLVINGQVTGTWKRQTRAKSQTLTVLPFTKLTPAQVSSIAPAVKRYQEFSSLETLLQLAD
jgi:hypothetical protein